MFKIDQDLFDEESGELDRDKTADYVDELLSQFDASPEGERLREAGASIHWTKWVIDYALDHLGVPVAELSVPDFDEILFDLFPRKMSTEAESAAEIVDELKGFWQFVHRQFGLPNASRIEATLDAAATNRLRKKLADPANYGMAKSFVMLGKQAGFDMTTQEGMEQFQLIYNAQLLNKRFPRPFPLDGIESNKTSAPRSMTPKARAELRKARKRQDRKRKR